MNFLVHTLEYKGGRICENTPLRHYRAEDFEQYKRIYENCFYEMRRTLGLPKECCKSAEELLKNRDSIFILEENGSIIGSAAVYGCVIDDLFTAREHQNKGIGLRLLRAAVGYLQGKNADRIILRAADINKAALSLYMHNGFVITETEEITR